jgi:8-amino-7-oxononanoate synthase
LAQVVTFGKALGVHGAIVLGKADLKQTLINFATPYVYTTALPLHSLAAIKCSYDQFPLLESKRVRLQALINYFCKSIPSSSLTPIHSLPVAGNAAAKHAVQLLAKRGCDVRALLSPTVQRGSEMLRICLHAFNTFEEMAKLIEAICKK